MAIYNPTDEELTLIEELEGFCDVLEELPRTKNSRRVHQLRSQINRTIKAAREIVVQSGCYHTMDISPPPAISAPTLRNVDPFKNMFSAPYGFDLRQQVIDMVEQAIGIIQAGEFGVQQSVQLEPEDEVASVANNKVFVVHGHDEAARESVARFLERLDLEAIILHEQPSSCKTVIEKVEKYSDVGYAVVLFTPDDMGAKMGDEDNLSPRARQNVILELGYFIGKLGRSNVTILLKGSIDWPSDFGGVVYTAMDTGGGWKMKLAQDMESASLNIDYDKLA